MRQHHAGGSDANALGGRRYRGHQHFRCRADDAGAVVMFGEPEAVIAEFVAQPRERQRFADRFVLVAALGGGGLIEDRKFHIRSRVSEKQERLRLPLRREKTCPRLGCYGIE